MAAPLDAVVFQGTVAVIGAFRCPVDHPAFRDSGPIEQCAVVFPRTSVWIRHEGSRRFVADPNLVTIYNRSQRYERAQLSPDGDSCDWFAVNDNAACEIACAFDPGATGRSSGPFPFQFAPSTASLYLAQRRLVQRAASGTADPLETEEAVVDIVARVLALAYQRPPQALARGVVARRRRQELVEYAKAELMRTITVNRTVTDLASTIGTSVFHLCRIFRSQTGRTIDQYRTELRTRLALELLANSSTRETLSDVAHRLGFASHSHFVGVCRRQLGTTPGNIRELLRASLSREELVNPVHPDEHLGGVRAGRGVGAEPVGDSRSMVGAGWQSLGRVGRVR